MIKRKASILFLLLSSFIQGQNLEKGIDLFNEGKLELARNAFLSVSEENPERNYYLGRIAFDNDELDDAVDYFEEAIELDEVAEYYTWLGNALGVKAQNSNVFTQGILAPQIKSAYEKSVSIDPKNIDAQWGLVQYYTQAPGFMGGSWEKAKETAIAIEKIDKLEGHDAMITVYLAQEKYDLVEEQYLKSTAIDETRLVNLGIFYQNRNQFEKTFDTFERAYQNDTTNYNALYQIGRTSALSGARFERGIECLTNYLNVEHQEGTPSIAGGLMRLGMIYEKQGNLAQAIEFYQKSLSLDSEMDLASEGLKRLK